MRKIGPVQVAVLFLLLWLAIYGGQIPGCTIPGIPSQKATAATYTIDDKKHSVPPPVAAALNTLNRRGIVATVDEVDTLDGQGEIPDQYRVSRPAAVAAGLPALVVMGGDKVLSVLKNPTGDQVEAVK